MSDFFGSNLVAILQTGFVGVSVVLMYMAYRLQDKIIGDAGSAAKLKIKRTSILIYLGVAAFVMLGALFVTLYPPPPDRIKVNVEIKPKKLERLKMVDLSIAGVSMDKHLLEESPGEMPGLELLSQNAFTVDLSGIENHINELKLSITGLDGEKASLNTIIDQLNVVKTQLEDEKEFLQKAKTELELNREGLSNQLQVLKDILRDQTIENNTNELSEAIVNEESGA